MTAPPQPDGADPTRDIRLPSLPDRPFPQLPAGWSRECSDVAAPPGPVAMPAPDVPAEPEPTAGPEPTTAGLQVDQPTDDVGRPPEGARDRTLTFDGTASERWAAGHAATPDPAWSPLPPRAGPVVVPRPRPIRQRGRRWPWVVLTLIPVLIIVGAGVWLLLILRAA